MLSFIGNPNFALNNKNFEEKLEDIDTKIEEKIEEVNVNVGEKIEEVNVNVGEKIEEVNVNVDEKIRLINTNIDEKIEDINIILDENNKKIKEDLSSNININRQTLGYTKKNLLKLVESKTMLNAPGVECAINKNNGSIVLNGYTEMFEGSFPIVDKLYLSAGTYIFTDGHDKNLLYGSYTQVITLYNINDEIINTYESNEGDPIIFTITQEQINIGVYVKYHIITPKYSSFNNSIFYPMIRSADIVDDTFEPYVNDINTRLNNIENINIYTHNISSWTAANGIDSSVSLYDGNYFNGLFFALSDDGKIFYSEDGINWTQGNCSATEPLRGIAYGNGIYVVVGNNGTTCYSTDGINWTVGTTGTSAVALTGVVYGKGIFVAVGNTGSTGRSWYSTDGINWTVGKTINYTIREIAYGNGKFVAVGNKGAIHSLDGINWVTESVTAGNMHNVTYGNGLFVAVGTQGSTWVSDNGGVWIKSNIGESTTIRAIAYANGLFILGGATGQLCYSEDGVNWTSGGVIGTTVIRAIMYGNGTIAAVGDTGTAFYSSFTTENYDLNNVVSSAHSKLDNISTIKIIKEEVTEDFINEFENEVMITGMAGSEKLYGVAYGNGKFVAVGNAGFSAYSTDGITWTAGNTTISSLLQEVTYGDNKFVAIGPARIIYSTDGITWTSKETSKLLYGVVYGKGKFVAVGTTAIVYSTDGGVTWIEKKINSDSLYGVTYGNEMFVAVGTSIDNLGVTYYSTDGITWIKGGTPSGAKSLQGVTYGNGMFVAVDSKGNVFYSTDAITWDFGGPTTDSNSSRGIAYGNGMFITASYSGNVFYSIDAKTWTAKETRNIAPEGIAYGNGMFVVVGVPNSNSENIGLLKLKQTFHFSKTPLEERTINEVTDKLYKNSLITRSTLKTGLTSITIRDSRITKDSALAFYTSIYGVNPIEVAVSTGSVTLTFNAQTKNMEVGVSIDG